MNPPDRRVVGVLHRRSVTPTAEVYIGKETNKLEEAEVGLIHNLGRILEVYADFTRGPWERLVRPVLHDIPARWLEERTEQSRRTIQRLRNGHSQPRRQHERALTAAAGKFAKEMLLRKGMNPLGGDVEALATYLSLKSAL